MAEVVPLFMYCAAFIGSRSVELGLFFSVEVIKEWVGVDEDVGITIGRGVGVGVGIRHWSRMFSEIMMSSLAHWIRYNIPIGIGIGDGVGVRSWSRPFSAVLMSSSVHWSRSWPSLGSAVPMSFPFNSMGVGICCGVSPSEVAASIEVGVGINKPRRVSAAPMSIRVWCIIV
jgi:hypothetical protein